MVVNFALWNSKNIELTITIMVQIRVLRANIFLMMIAGSINDIEMLITYLFILLDFFFTIAYLSDTKFLGSTSRCCQKFGSKGAMEIPSINEETYILPFPWVYTRWANLVSISIHLQWGASAQINQYIYIYMLLTVIVYPRPDTGARMWLAGYEEKNTSAENFLSLSAYTLVNWSQKVKIR